MYDVTTVNGHTVTLDADPIKAFKQDVHMVELWRSEDYDYNDTHLEYTLRIVIYRLIQGELRQQVKHEMQSDSIDELKQDIIEKDYSGNL